jgi:hypothetical protein
MTRAYRSILLYWSQPLPEEATIDALTIVPLVDLTTPNA